MSSYGYPTVMKFSQGGWVFPMPQPVIPHIPLYITDGSRHIIWTSNILKVTKTLTLPGILSPDPRQEIYSIEIIYQNDPSRIMGFTWAGTEGKAIAERIFARLLQITQSEVITAQEEPPGSPPQGEGEQQPADSALAPTV